jgi:hypothetical protein
MTSEEKINQLHLITRILRRLPLPHFRLAARDNETLRHVCR